MGTISTLTRIVAVGVCLLIVTTTTKGAPELQISSLDKRFYLNEGSNVTLECTMRGEGFSAFNNPIIWYKQQPDGHLVQVNTGAVINDPFADTGRYDVTPEDDRHKDVPEVLMPLRITGITLGENGTYKCELKDKQGVLDSVTYTLVIPRAVNTLTLSSNYSTVGDNESKRLFEFEEGENTFIACRSRGGNPAPKLRIFRDEFDITHEFTERVVETTSGTRGLQFVNYEVSLMKTDFLASLDQVGQNLKCHARIRRRPEFKRTATAVIDVKYAPHFHCASQRTVFEYTRDYEVDCVVQSNPKLQLDSVYWSVGDNATVNVSLGQTVAGFSANATVDSTYRVRAVLTIAEVNLTSLQSYHLVARNSLGERRYQIVLSEVTTTQSTTTVTEKTGLTPSDEKPQPVMSITVRVASTLNSVIALIGCLAIVFARQ